MWSGAKPGSTVRRRQKLWIKRLAAPSRASDNASSITIKTSRVLRPDRLAIVERMLVSPSADETFGRENRQAGDNPKRTPVNSETPTDAANTTASILISPMRGKSVGSKVRKAVVRKKATRTA